MKTVNEKRAIVLAFLEFFTNSEEDLYAPVFWSKIYRGREEEFCFDKESQTFQSHIQGLNISVGDLTDEQIKNLYEDIPSVVIEYTEDAMERIRENCMIMREIYEGAAEKGGNPKVS